MPQPNESDSIVAQTLLSGAHSQAHVTEHHEGSSSSSRSSARQQGQDVRLSPPAATTSDVASRSSEGTEGADGVYLVDQPEQRRPESKASNSEIEQMTTPPTPSTVTNPHQQGAGGDIEKDADGKEVIWVEFEPDDPENPFNFSRFRKYSIVLLATVFTGEVAATASAYVPGIPSMERDLNVTNHYLSLLGISIYPLGFALPPLILAPFSEVFGRSPVYFVSYVIYLACFIGVGLSPNIASVLVFRFIQGAASSTGSTLVGGTIADFTTPSERGKFMALFATAAIGGTGFGPSWTGWVEQNPNLGWRYIQWIQLAYTGAVFVVLCLVLKETRGSVILTRRAVRLRKETGDTRYRARAEAERASLAILITQSLTRPIWFLVSEPIVTWFSIWISWLWAVMYSLLNSVGLIAKQHGYSPGEESSLFWAIVFAAFLGQLTNPIQDHLYKKYYPVRGPEARLFMSMVTAVLFPIGCFIYAWTSYPHISIAGPIVGIILLMVSVYHIYLCVFSYLADSYGIYASSALASQSFSRNVFGFSAPLFTTPLYEKLGYQWASSFVGFLGAALGVVPFILFFYGSKIRARSNFASRVLKMEEEQRERAAAAAAAAAAKEKADHGRDEKSQEEA